MGSKTQNYKFSLVDDSDLVNKDNINTPIEEIDKLILQKTNELQNKLKDLENRFEDYVEKKGNAVIRDDGSGRWYMMIAENIIMQGGNGYSDLRANYFIYEMVDSNYIVTTGKYNSGSGSGVCNVHQRTNRYIICNGRGQGGSGFPEYTPIGYSIVGRVKTPLRITTFSVKETNKKTLVDKDITFDSVTTSATIKTLCSTASGGFIQIVSIVKTGTMKNNFTVLGAYGAWFEVGKDVDINVICTPTMVSNNGVSSIKFNAKVTVYFVAYSDAGMDG